MLLDDAATFPGWHRHEASGKCKQSDLDGRQPAVDRDFKGADSANSKS